VGTPKQAELWSMIGMIMDHSSTPAGAAAANLFETSPSAQAGTLVARLRPIVARALTSPDDFDPHQAAVLRAFNETYPETRTGRPRSGTAVLDRKVTVHMDEGTLDQIRQRATARGVTPSEYVRAVVDQHIGGGAL
jgi:hypothetical protein